MKNILFLILFVLSAPCSLLAQIYLDGSTMTIKSGAVVYSKGDVTTVDNAILNNEGSLITLRDINNVGTATMQGNGQYTLQGDWNNSATFLAGTSSVNFEGSNNSTVTSGGGSFYDLNLAKTAADLLLADDMLLSHDLEFVSDDNLVFIVDNDLSFGVSATVTSYDDNDYIVTGGAGVVRRSDLGATAFVFPIGFDANTYNPITIVQSVDGIVDEFGVRVLEVVFSEGGSGSVFFEDVVDATWELTEALAGGSDLTITAQWAGTDELIGFNRNDCGISRYDGSGWDLSNADAGMAAGADPYTRTRSGVTEVGYFAVGGVQLMTYVALTPKVFLQGAYSTSSNLMSDNLRTIYQAPPNETLRLLPLIEPYSALSNFTHVGRGGGETVDPSVLDNTGDINHDIVDWVFLELRDKNASSSVLQTRSALLQRDGEIVDIDGVSEVRFEGVASDDYYLSVRHRNHLGVRTPSVLTLSRTAVGHDFTTAQSQANGSNPMFDISGVFCLWAGNSSLDDKVRYQGTSNDRDAIKNDILSHPGNLFNILTYTYTGYSPSDLNLDSKVKYQGTNNDPDVIKNNILSHPGNVFNILTYTISQQLP
ncbi:MAG: hypothetical protein ABIV51_01325 [Saprospiraceae bacterium]